MISAAQLLDELMGRDRNLAPDEKRSNVRWDHESVSPVGLGPVPRGLGEGELKGPEGGPRLARAGCGAIWGDLAAPTEAPDGGGRRACGPGRREDSAPIRGIAACGVGWGASGMARGWAEEEAPW